MDGSLSCLYESSRLESSPLASSDMILLALFYLKCSIIVSLPYTLSLYCFCSM